MDRHDSNATFEAARAATHILTDGALIDPRTMGIRLSEGLGVGTLPFEMRISSAMLVHELEQAGVDLGTTTLEEFLKADVRDHGETALQGYLGIVQAVTMPQAKRGFMGLFGGPAAVPPVNLWVTRIGRIYIENEALVIAGEAEASS